MMIFKTVLRVVFGVCFLSRSVCASELEGSKLFKHILYSLDEERPDYDEFNKNLYKVPTLSSPYKEHLDDLQLSKEDGDDDFTITNATDSLKNSPKTFFVISGIAQEAYSSVPFQGVMKRASHAKATFAQSVAESSDPFVTYFTLEKNKTKLVNINKVVKLGSIDQDNKELVRIVLLKVNTGSLDSFRTIEAQAGYYIERISKYYELTSDINDAYFIGHSKGAAQALEIISGLSMGRYESVDWFDNIRGVISINGALRGSHIADLSQQEGNKYYKALRHGDSLLKLDTEKVGGIILPKNVKIITKALLGLYRDMYDEIAKDELALTDLLKLNVFGTVFDFTKLLLTRDNTIAANIKSFYSIARESITELSEENRTNWWRDNTIPSHLQYFSIASVSSNEMNPDYIAKGSVDYSILKILFKDFENYNLAKNYDGLLSLGSSVFDPEYHMELNPDQQPYEQSLLAILHAHHGTPVLSRLFQDFNRTYSTYPRKALLLSLAAYIEMSNKNIEPTIEKL